MQGINFSLPFHTVLCAQVMYFINVFVKYGKSMKQKLEIITFHINSPLYTIFCSTTKNQFSIIFIKILKNIRKNVLRKKTSAVVKKYNLY